MASISFITAARAAEMMGDLHVSMMTPSSRLCEAIEEFSGNSRPLRYAREEAEELDATLLRSSWRL